MSDNKSILVISELNDYVASVKNHYSLTKGFNIAKGFAKSGVTYYVTLGKSEIIDGVNLVNISEIGEEFINKLTYILLIRETNIDQIFKDIPEIKLMFTENKHENIKIVIKSDSIGWIVSKQYKAFCETYKYDWLTLLKRFNFICVQTEELKDEGLKLLSAPFRVVIEPKIFISPMGVNNHVPDLSNIQNPYDVNHDYCVNNFAELNRSTNSGSGKALHPLCFTGLQKKWTTHKVAEYNIKKTILIYTGRIKTDGGKTMLMLRDIMNMLGPLYELHIFPGRFQIPGLNISVLSPKFNENLQIMRDVVFSNCTNVIIHVPYDENEKDMYVGYADIGIDFSSSRPKNILSSAGGAKLLEYCYYGLKVVAETNINNSHLVKDANNGILLDGLASVKDYVEAIKKLSSKEYCDSFDKLAAINQTIKTNNWDVFAEKLLIMFNNSA